MASPLLAAYVTLMERHLVEVARIRETDLIARLERDFPEVGIEDITASTLIKRWSAAGFLDRRPFGKGLSKQNYCSLTEDARDAVSFLRRQHRVESLATGGSLDNIATTLDKIASQLDDDLDRVRSGYQEQISELQRRIDEIDEGRRPDPDYPDLTDQAHGLAGQLSRTIDDVVRYSSTLDAITAELPSGTDDSSSAFRDRSGRLFDSYDHLHASRERLSYRAFTQILDDEDRQERMIQNIKLLTEKLVELDPRTREEMLNFFPRVKAHTVEVGRVAGRSANRVNTHFQFGTSDRSRGLNRQLNEAFAAGQELLKLSSADSLTKITVPFATVTVTSIERYIISCAEEIPAKPADDSEPLMDLDDVPGFGTQVDVPALIELVNDAVAMGPVSLQEVVGMVENPFFGDISTLLHFALQQNDVAGDYPRRPVNYYRYPTGERCVAELPELFFTKKLSNTKRAPL